MTTADSESGLLNSQTGYSRSKCDCGFLVCGAV